MVKPNFMDAPLGYDDDSRDWSLGGLLAVLQHWAWDGR
jgi:hypothetical protein